MSIHQGTTWVVVADSTLCKIYDYQRKPEELILVKTFNHPENRLKDTELSTDRQGRYQAGDSIHGAFAAHSDPKEVKIDEFAREIANDLNHHRLVNAYERLMIVSPPHMDGLLLQHLDKHVEDLITHNIKKDVIHLKEHQLLDFLHTHQLT